MCDVDGEEVSCALKEYDERLDGMTTVWRHENALLRRTSSSARGTMQSIMTVPRCLEPNNSGMRSALICCLDSNVKRNLLPLRLVGSFFEFIPSRLGRNVALDDAVACLCAIYRETTLIQYHLHDCALAMEPEALCASILLHYCELILGDQDKEEWSQLANRNAVLLYSRGVDRYKSDFEQANLESQLPFVVTQSIKAREHCFLCAPEWQALLTVTDKSRPFQAAQSWSLSTSLLSRVIDLPSLIIDSSEMERIDCLAQAGQNQRLNALINRVMATSENIKSWLHAEAAGLSASSKPLHAVDAIKGKDLVYADVLSGILDCIAHTALISLTRLVQI